MLCMEKCQKLNIPLTMSILLVRKKNTICWTFLLSGDPRLANQNAAQIITSHAHTLGSHWPDVCNCIEGRSVGEQKLATVGPLHCYDIEAGPKPMTESRNGKKEKQIILRLMLHLLGCQKERKIFASSGNRTRVVWAVVAEWLRRLTRNEFPSGSVGSNPTNCEKKSF